MPRISSPSADSVVLSVPQFLAAYGIGRDTFYGEVNRGRLRIAKIGTRTLISKAEAARWFAERETTTLQ